MKRTFCITFLILFFTNSVISQTEAIKALVEKTNELNLDMWDLTTYAEEHIKDKEELAKFFYYWIGSNIQYDHKSLKEKNDGIITLEDYNKRQDEFEVYKNRKGVCAGYAKLYQWFLDWVDIETVVIPGHIRDARNHYVELSEKDFSHAWNAIKLNNKWLLVDTTWGTSNEESQSEFYFDIKPEYLIITHYPEDSKWQLLKEPLTLSEFNNSQFIKPIWFMIGFTEVPKLMADPHFYYFTFQDLPNNKWSVGLIMSTDNLNFEPINDMEVIDQDGRTYFRFRKAQVPKTAYFKVKMVKFEKDGDQYFKTEHDDVINFKI
ncbi:hypothetical protein N7U66_10035 [Lacinutrix neustonica]|uniref:Transglutaminase-like domain-containing protein n=1 Tax=Lacinutrix neustonica TaxID=2980107 RepID=A0A9E8MZH1_9FLAO|nr:transglutaminase domain-containing protein [Lacinutrix neustonica]WAC03729.1 hypothetical protein N7U66_10035 [Lacinutrix neustonica]